MFFLEALVLSLPTETQEQFAKGSIGNDAMIARHYQILRRHFKYIKGSHQIFFKIFSSPALCNSSGEIRRTIILGKMYYFVDDYCIHKIFPCSIVTPEQKKFGGSVNGRIFMSRLQPYDQCVRTRHGVALALISRKYQFFRDVPCAMRTRRTFTFDHPPHLKLCVCFRSLGEITIVKRRKSSQERKILSIQVFKRFL